MADSLFSSLPYRQLKKTYRSEYGIWVEMKHRCRNPRHRNWKEYGGRGISVCESWRDSFRAFLSDVGPKPSALHTIERLNNDGDYSPDNCKWATRAEQSRNTRWNRLLTYRGETKCASAWAETLGMDKQTIYDRLHWGWDVEDIFTTPVCAHQTMISHDGRTMTVTAWAREVGISRKTITKRIKNGWTAESALFTPTKIGRPPKQR